MLFLLESIGYSPRDIPLAACIFSLTGLYATQMRAHASHIVTLHWLIKKRYKVSFFEKV